MQCPFRRQVLPDALTQGLKRHRHFLPTLRDLVAALAQIVDVLFPKNTLNLLVCGNANAQRGGDHLHAGGQAAIGSPHPHAAPMFRAEIYVPRQLQVPGKAYALELRVIGELRHGRVCQGLDYL